MTPQPLPYALTLPKYRSYVLGVLLLVAGLGHPTFAAVSESSEWFSVFQDSLITDLVYEGLDSNLDIQIATEKLKLSEALATATRGESWPYIYGKASSVRGNTNYGQLGTFSQAGLHADWIPDLFGKTHAKVVSKESEIRRAEAVVDLARTQSVAAITNAALTYRYTQQELTLLKKQIDLYDKLYDIQQTRLRVGLGDKSSVAEIQAQRYTVNARLPEYQRVGDQALNALVQALNGPDMGTVRDRFSRTPAKTAVPNLDVLENRSIQDLGHRPDVKMAVADIVAASANISEATAALFPELSLSSFFGIQDGTDNLPAAETPAWSVGAAIQLPLFNFGRLDGLVDASKYMASDARYTYEKTVRTAFQETYDAYTAYKHAVMSLAEQHKATEAYKVAHETALQRFKNGLTDQIPVLQAEIVYTQSLSQTLSMQRQVSQRYVDVETALASVVKNK